MDEAAAGVESGSEGHTVFELKPLSASAIPSALAKAERYRLINEPEQSESICEDIPRRSGQPAGEGDADPGHHRRLPARQPLGRPRDGTGRLPALPIRSALLRGPGLRA